MWSLTELVYKTNPTQGFGNANVAVDVVNQQKVISLLYPPPLHRSVTGWQQGALLVSSFSLKKVQLPDDCKTR